MYKLNISIDDVSPHPRSSTKVLKQCFSLIEKYPDIKFSLFIPAAYWRTQKEEQKTTFPLSILFHPNFCEELRSLPKNNFELCYHGIYHGIPGQDNNNEFRDLTYREAITKFTTMIDLFKQADLPMSKVFRPPAWKMSAEAINASASMIDILALCNEHSALETYKNAHLDKKVVICTIPSPQFGLTLDEKTCICYHACEWDTGYFNDALRDALEKFINLYNPEFVFMDKLLVE